LPSSAFSSFHEVQVSIASTVFTSGCIADRASIGANAPRFGVPASTTRAPSCAMSRFQTSGATISTVRATSPPIECASTRTGSFLPARAASAIDTALARSRALSSIGRRQS
jgi:hypothetical protein